MANRLLCAMVVLMLVACGRSGETNVVPPQSTAVNNRETAITATYTERLAYAFDGVDGATPYGPTLIFDSSGDLYGTTSYLGAYGNGNVFELMPASGGSWTLHILYSFKGKPDGAAPYSGVVFGDANHLYGTTNQGGTGCADYGCGTVYELTRSGSSWSEHILHRFLGTPDGYGPWGPVTLDSRGNIFGTTTFGGSCAGQEYAYGTAYELVRGTTGFTEQMLHSFCGPPLDGQNPAFTPLVFDKGGELYGTSAGGSATGVIYKLHQSSTGQWSETVLHDFARSQGYVEQSGLTMDASGDLYGTGSFGGTYDNGTVWEFTTTRVLKVLYSFQGGTDGTTPFLAPVFDARGNLIGTTHNGGIAANGCYHACGTVYKLTPQSGGTWKESIIHGFGTPVGDGYNPVGTVTIGADGKIYGTTTKGGGQGTYGGDGSIYEITP